MTSEMLGSIRALAPISDVIKTHAAQVDRALELLDGRLDQVERAHIRTEATLAGLFEKLNQLERHEARLKSLEDDRVRVKAWAALIAFLGSIAAFLIGKLWAK